MNIEIKISNYRCFPDDQPLVIRLEDGQIAFLGTNNSGKSTILRFFNELRSIWDQLNHASGIIQSLQDERGFNVPPHVRESSELYHDRNNRDASITIAIPSLDAPQKLITILLKRPTNRFQITRLLSDGMSLEKIGRDEAIRTDYQAHTAMFPTGATMYLAPLVEAFGAFRDAMYIGPFRNAVNVGGNQQYFDLQIGTNFITAWAGWKAGASKDQNRRAQRVTEDIRKIFRLEQFEINSAPDNQTLQVVINNHPYHLQEVGAGISQFIIALASAAMRAPSFIMIDEPENHLHPALQVQLLSALGQYAEHGVYFSTHSIGLARSVADKIYSVTKKNHAAGIKEWAATSNLIELLGEMSYAGYRELGCDSILLVEGVNDIKTIRQLLRTKNLDRKLVILPLGGGALLDPARQFELSEIRRLSSKAFCIIDSERTDKDAPVEPKRVAFRDICEKAGIKTLILERRALENYLTDRAIKQAHGDGYSALEPYCRLSDAPKPWTKSGSWKIAQHMEIEEIADTDLGSFLAHLVKDLN